MNRPSSESLWRAFLYGGGSMLLAFNLFFLAKAAIRQNFVPVVPIVAGIFTAAGLLFVVYAEHRARIEDKEDHRRISRVANQLENPLRALQDDLTQLVAAGNKLPSEERLKLKRMETKSKILLENIRDVFLTLQAHEGPLAQDVRVYDLCQLVKDGIDRNQSLARARNVELVHKMHCANAPVKVDRRLFLIALVHLIENGILYTASPGFVNIAVIRGQKNARVIVQDRGIGMKAKDAHVMFEPFARGPGAEQFDPDGIGVGLTLARLILQEFKGKLTWQPKGDKGGSHFEMQLPLTTSD